MSELEHLARDPADDSSSSSSSDEEGWVTAYDSEFDMTLSDIDDDLLAAMQQFDIDDAPIPIAGSATNDDTRYLVAGNRTTPYWSEAARAQREGSHVEAIVKRTKIKCANEWFVVVVGKPPGIYSYRESTAHTKGTSNVYQGYPTRDMAERAWTKAQEMGIVGSEDGLMPRDFLLESLPLESAIVPPPSPLSAPGDGRRFYVVYRGRFTGIFNSSLEAGLSVLNVPGNAHESQITYAVASRKYKRARERNEVAIINTA